MAEEQTPSENALGSTLENGQASSTTTDRLAWPSSYGTESGHWILFDRYVYSKGGIEEEGTARKDSEGKTIALPVPSDLNVNYAATWENENEGIAGAQIVNAEHIGMQKLNRFFSGNGSMADAFSVFHEAAKGLPKWLLNNGLDAATNTEVFSRILQAGGAARNPYQAVVFRSPEFRTFQFQWDIFPANRDESDTIRAIFKEFKLGMSPSFFTGLGDITGASTNLFTYPNLWKISFTNPDYLFKMHFCTVHSVNINYHKEGTPVYFNVTDKKIPASMRLSVNFQEAKVLTKEDMEDGY